MLRVLERLRAHLRQDPGAAREEIVSLRPLIVRQVPARDSTDRIELPRAGGRTPRPR